ncbi:MAG: NERD domain-containing protein [Saprospiraceae bacterium]|nr:NERD domain-containing protein [Saprospiraceae bacterium]
MMRWKSRNIQLFFVAAVLLISLFLFRKKDGSSESRYYKTITALNVRRGPGKNYTLLFTLKKGEKINVLSKIEDWYKIEKYGRSGYVHSKHVKPIGNGIAEDPSSFFSPNLSLSNFFVLLLMLLSKVTTTERGTYSERDLVLKLLHYGVPEEKIFHDLFVEEHKNHFSQLDVVAVTEVGIIVFEVKDFSGWIYGSASQHKWTKVLNYGKEKYRFYNPILQNANHIKELQKHLSHISNIPFISVIVFYGNCEIKEIDYVPRHTYVAYESRVFNVLDKILTEYPKVYYTDENHVLNVLRNAVINGSVVENQLKHIENIKDMLGEDRVFG